MNRCRFPHVVLFTIAALAAFPLPAGADEPAKDVRVGIIGVDTSHAITFTKEFNDPQPAAELRGIRIVAAFPGGSADIASSRDRVPKHTQRLRDMGVEIVDTIPALLERVDAVLLESSDGRVHLEQIRPVFEAKKPVFIDKPMAASLADGMAIAELGTRHGVPWFSCSALRYTPAFQAMRAKDAKAGDVLGCDAWSPCSLDPTHPDLFWYGIHGVETLYTVMGAGCAAVSRTSTADTDHAVGTWKDGRIGTFRGLRSGKQDYGVTVFGSKAVATAGGFGGYKPLLVEIANFFRTGKPPIEPAETLEILAFMEAADESKRQGGTPVTIESVMARARETLAKREK